LLASVWEASTPFKQCVWCLIIAKNMLPMFLPVVHIEVHPRGWHIWGVSRCFSPCSFLSLQLKKHAIPAKIKRCPPFSSYFNYSPYFFLLFFICFESFLFISSLCILFIFIINLFSPIPLDFNDLERV